MMKNAQSEESVKTTTNFNSTTVLFNNNNNLKSNNDDDYDPFKNRQLEHPNNYTGAFIHIVKTALGTGILAIPRAFKSAGLIVGLFGSIIIGLLCTHTIHMLVDTSQKICKKSKIPSLGYADTTQAAFESGPPKIRKFGIYAKFLVEGGLFSIHYLADSVYLVIISVSLTKFFEEFYPETSSWDKYIFKLIILVPLLICGQVRQLKHLVPFSFIANVFLMITFGITSYYMFSGITEIDIKNRTMATGFSGIPSFFSTVLFSMEGIGTIMPVENSMTEPTFLGWTGVLNAAMSVIIFLYTTIGFFGYYRFGDKTEATITKNLPDGELASQIVQITIAIAVFFSYMLVFYVPIDIAWSHLKCKIPEKRHNIAQIILRSVLILISTGIAIAGGDHLGSLIDLIGAIFLSTLGFLVPALVDTIFRYENGWGKFNWRLIKNVLIMFLSLFALVSGSISAFNG